MKPAFRPMLVLAVPVAVATWSMPAWAQQQSGQAQVQQQAQQEPTESEQSQGAQQAQKAPDQSKLSEQDRAFAKRTAIGKMLVIKLDKLAQKNAGSEAVKSFAKELVQAHMQAAEMMKQIVKKLVLTPPKQLPERQQDLIAGLRELEELALFDQEYVWNIITIHTVAVNVFEEEVQQGSNPMLVKFAESVRPKLQQHRDRAVDIWNGMG